MEKMKRLLSGFLALVLVLGMMPAVPMTAGAEELETQPETVAVETTEATEAAETTEAAGDVTIPATTLPEETEPAETVPAETEAEQTLPAETEAEETIPAETEEVTEVTEAVAGAFETVDPVEEIQVVASKTRTYLGDRVKLSAIVSPENVLDDSVTWVMSDGYITDTLEDGSVLFTSDTPGVVEIYAVSVEVPEDPAVEPVRSESIYVTFLEYKMEINILDLPEKNRFEKEDPRRDTHARIQAGERIKLNAKYMTGLLPEDQAGYDGAYKVESLSEPKITWSMKWLDEGVETDGAEEFIALTVDPQDPTKVTLYAKAVTQTYTVRLYAKDLIAGTHSIDVVVYPVPYKVMVEADSLHPAMNWDADTNTLVVNVNGMTEADFENPVKLFATVYPVEAPQALVWDCEPGTIYLLDPDKDETPAEELDREMDLYVTNYTGTTTFTAASADAPAATTTITVKQVRVMDAERLSISLASSKITDLVAGQQQQFNAIDIKDREILEPPVVEWSFADEKDYEYATITKGGLVTVKNIASGRILTLKCTITDHPHKASITHNVTVHPKATKVEILPGDLTSGFYPSDMVCNGKLLYVNTTHNVDPFRLAAVVYPVDDTDPGAMDEVKWTSTNSNIASVHPDTQQIIWEGKEGTVTLQATATDGSRKSASVNLKFCMQADGVEIILPHTDYVRVGTTLPLDVKLTPAKVDQMASKNSVTWVIEGCDTCVDEVKCAKISASGVVTPKTVREKHCITVRATTKDGAYRTDDCNVYILPKLSDSLILQGDIHGMKYLSGTTQMADQYESFQLEVLELAIPSGQWGVDWTGADITEDTVAPILWSTSNKNVAEVDDYGFVDVKAPGTAVITAKANDGTNRTAKVTIKCVRMASEIVITAPKDQTTLASGKSMTLRAVPYYDSYEGIKATVQKVDWKLDEDGKKLATLSNGRLTAKKDYTDPPATITVYAYATDGSTTCGTYDVEIYPVAQGVQIDTSSLKRSGNNYLYQLVSAPEYLSMSAAVYPTTASQDVKWTSSNKAIVEVIDPATGDMEIKKSGTVTLTATAQDGSNKKQSIRLTVVREAAYVSFNNVNFCYDGRMVIGGGKTVTLKPTLWDADDGKISGRKLKWSIADFEGDDDNGLAYVTRFSNGTLVTKAVSEMKKVVITLETVEDHEDFNALKIEIPVEIWPVTNSVQIARLTAGELVEVTTTLYMHVGDTMDLDAISYTTNPTIRAVQVWDWKSSNEKVAEIDPITGEIYGVKAGTVTITASAKDGSGKRDTVRVVVQKP